MKKNILLSLLFLISSLAIFAQNNSSSEVERTFTFDNESSVSEFVIEITPNSEMLFFALHSIIKQGDLRVSLISPSGKKEGGFRLSSSTGKSESSSSSISKSSSSSKSKSKSNSNSISNSNSNSNNSININSSTGSSDNSVEVRSDAENSFTYNISSSSNSTAKGNMNKSITKPEAGTWKVVIDPKQVSGEIQIKIGQKSNN